MGRNVLRWTISWLDQSFTKKEESVCRLNFRRPEFSPCRIPSIILPVLIVAFLFTTQKEFLQSTMAIITVAAGLIPLLAKLLETMEPTTRDRG